MADTSGLAEEDAGQSLEELEANLAEYRQQLQNVEACLASDPGNTEYLEMKRELEDVITLTEEVLSEQRQAEGNGLYQGTEEEEAVLNEASVLDDAAALHRAMAQEGRAGLGRPPAPPQAPDGTLSIRKGWHEGAKCQARWTEDGMWYNATILSFTDKGALVVFDEYENKDEVTLASLRPRPADAAHPPKKKGAEPGGPGGVQVDPLTLKRRKLMERSEEFLEKGIPEKMRIKPEDSEEVKAKKRKMIHAFKSSQRLVKQETESARKQSAWKDFQTGKTKAKKPSSSPIPAP
eukprot:jgi/Mesvir1/24253/Mv10955-RA.2